MGADDYADSLQHIALIAEKRRRLEEAQAEAEEQFIHRAATDLRAGRISVNDLVDLWATFRGSALPGYSNRWKAQLPDHSPNRLGGLARDRERDQLFTPDEDGNWRGVHPIEREVDRRPRNGQPVVYVLYDGDARPCYVGSTQSLFWRLHAHDRDGKKFVRWLAYPCADRDAAYALEGRLLREHKPYLNRRAAA